MWKTTLFLAMTVPFWVMAGDNSIDLFAHSVPGTAVEAAPTQSNAPSDDLTLDDVLKLAMAHNPELQASSYDLAAAEATAAQIGRLPNPELAVELENFGGEGAFQNTQSAETTLMLSQMIETGGKRKSRKALAHLDKQRSRGDLESRRQNLARDVRKRFVAVLAAQEMVGLQTELVALSQKTLEVVAAKVAAGKVSPLEETKARVALSATLLERDRAGRDLLAVRANLAAYWGGATMRQAKGDLTAIDPLPDFAAMNTKLDQNPDIARRQTEIRASQTEIDLMRAGRLPNLTLQAGVRRLQDTGSNTFVVGVSLPIPIFDRNKDAVSAARHRNSAAAARAADTRNVVAAALASSYHNAVAAYDTVTVLQDQILPAAREAFDGIHEGYREGKFSLLDVLDAQRTLFSARGNYIEALMGYHHARIDVRRLAGDTTISEGEAGHDF